MSEEELSTCEVCSDDVAMDDLLKCVECGVEGCDDCIYVRTEWDSVKHHEPPYMCYDCFEMLKKGEDE